MTKPNICGTANIQGIDEHRYTVATREGVLRFEDELSGGEG